MPLDGTTYIQNPVYDLLSRAQDRIRDPDRWRQGRLLDIAGRACSMGAIYIASGVSECTIMSDFWRIPKIEIVMEATSYLGIASHDIKGCNPTSLNDYSDHFTVMEMFDMAKEMCLYKETVNAI